MLDQGAEMAFMNVAADQGEGAETAEEQLQELLGAFFTAEVQTVNESGKASGGVSVGTGSRAPARGDDETPLSAVRSADASLATGQTSPYGDESASLASGPPLSLEDEPLDLDEQTAKLSAFLPPSISQSPSRSDA